MATVTQVDQNSDSALSHDMAQPVLAEGEYSLPESESRPSCTSGAWRVVVQVREHVVSRQVWYGVKPWVPENSAYPDRQHPEVIWPTWPATLAEEIATSASPLADLQRRWDATTSRLRDSAKWMAAVLGAALASVIPTAPLAGLSQRHISGTSAALGLCGLVSVSITMLLVLRVMRPQSVAYDEIQDAEAPAGLQGRLHKLARKYKRHSHALESPLYRWKNIIGEHPDLYLPCGVSSLVALRQLMVVEETTLVALARATENAMDNAVRKKLCDAKAARAARLYELRTTAASIVAVGAYYNVRARSTWATYGGVAFGLLGVVAVIAAVAWPIK